MGLQGATNLVIPCRVNRWPQVILPIRFVKKQWCRRVRAECVLLLRYGCSDHSRIDQTLVVRLEHGKQRLSGNELFKGLRRQKRKQPVRQ